MATTSVRSRLALEQHRLDAAGDRSTRGGLTALRHAGADIDLFAARLAAVDPTRALARGWSITRNESGAIVRSLSDLREGDTLVTQLVDGNVTSTVSEINELKGS
jgi:exodeoxyribonuclease VII large subunit